MVEVKLSKWIQRHLTTKTWCKSTARAENSACEKISHLNLSAKPEVKVLR